MHVSVDIPEPKTGLDAALAKQFADIQKSLLALVKSQQASQQDVRTELLDAMQSQQTSLVHAMERLLGVVAKSSKDSGHTEALAEALRGIKEVVADLPGDLKDALDKQYQSVQAKTMKVNPHVTVKMPSGLLDRLDSLEEAMVQGMKRSRNRTFGSNY